MNERAYIVIIYAFLLGVPMRRVWGYTLFWFGMGMLVMYIIGRGLLGILLIAAALFLSYWLFS